MTHFIIYNVYTSTAAASTETTDKELEDKAIKEELEPIETEEIREEDEDNTAKQEEEGKEEQEEQQSNDDTSGTGLEEDIMIDDNYSSDEDVPLELPFDNPMPFP